MTPKQVDNLVSTYNKGAEMQKKSHKAVREAIFDIVKEYGEVTFKRPLYVKPGGYKVETTPQDGWNVLSGAFFDTKNAHLFPKGRVLFFSSAEFKETTTLFPASIMENDSIVLKEIINSITNK